jgi:alanyl-tRNA synthetase
MSMLLSVPTAGLFQRIEEMQNLSTKNQKELLELRNQIALSKFKKTLSNIQTIKDATVLTLLVPDASVDTLRRMADEFKAEHPNAVIVLGSKIDEQAVLVASVAESMVERGISAGEIIKHISAIVGGKGGGRPGMAQGGGKEPEKMDDALNAAAELIQKKLDEK